MSNSSIVAGPFLFVDKVNTSNQRTICILDQPWRLNIREYVDGTIKNNDKQVMPDFETALVRLRTNSVLYEASGYEAIGIGNATKGKAPIADPVYAMMQKKTSAKPAPSKKAFQFLKAKLSPSTKLPKLMSPSTKWSMPRKVARKEPRKGARKGARKAAKKCKEVGVLRRSKRIAKIQNKPDYRDILTNYKITCEI